MDDTRSPPAVGARVRVFWPAERRWFEGEVDRVGSQDERPIFHVVYDDGDDDWRRMGDAWEVLEAPRDVPMAEASPAAGTRRLEVVDHGEVTVALSDAAGLTGRRVMLPNSLWDGCEADTRESRCTIVGFSATTVAPYRTESRAPEEHVRREPNPHVPRHFDR